MRGSRSGSCDDRCGCPAPCPGGIACAHLAEEEEEMRQRWSTSSARAGNTVDAIPVSVPRRKRWGGLGRPFASVVLDVPVLLALQLDI
ncbi:hypothetical protein RD792_016491 [Penstemon davidsonii]|uniref:Uncharacterized protein n=1 Tax=Penstemon davidsonii TaxID=160366 RepID=A0ABR0CJZ7_9LAMI|nr:hypothetical protein RD792_016491 [Penstemon davidsonii]